MRLGISNIAWDVDEDALVARLLNAYQVDAIDIAPGKYFPDPAAATRDEIVRVRQWWADRGVEITGMQSLLFGTTGLNVFGTQESRTAMLGHLGAICRIGGILGSTRLVFGSPKNRDRSGLSDVEAMTAATVFFRQLGDVAASEGVVICLEPNPPCYGANFMTTSMETADVVRQIDHPAIRMNLDAGAMQINGEDPRSVIGNSADLIGHIHASEPGLVVIGDGGTDHLAISVVLEEYLPGRLVSIEMVGTKDEAHLVSIERALKHAVSCYRSATSEGIR